MAVSWSAATPRTGPGKRTSANCQQAQKQLADYSAGFTRGKRRARLQAHLAVCPACREHLAQLRALDQLLAGESVSADEALVHRIMAQVQEADILRRWRRRWLLEGVGPIVAALSLGAATILIVQPYATEWTAALSTWELEWELLAQPQWALGAVVGLPLVAGAVAWLTTWLAETLT